MKKSTSTGSKPNSPSSKTSVSKTISPKKWVRDLEKLPDDPKDFQSLEFHAVCGEGLVDLLIAEIRPLSLKIHSQNRGGVFFSGSREAVFHFLLRTEIASQVGFTLADWTIRDVEDLYNSARRYPWENWLSARTGFRIDSKTKDCLPDSRFAMYRLKDAILDRFRDAKLPLPDVGKETNGIALSLRSFMDHAKLEILLTPESLTKRGYRAKAGEATLRENLASAMIQFSEWDGRSPVIDPFCGQGTLLIEACLSHTKGFHRNWETLCKSRIFQDLFSEEIARMESLQEKRKSCVRDSSRSKSPTDSTVPLPRFIGWDHSPEAIEQAKSDAKRAGVDDQIEFRLGSLEKDCDLDLNEPIYILTDPPFGKRLGSREESQEIFARLGRFLKDWKKKVHLCLITGDPSLLGYLKLKKEKEMSLKNSQISSKIVLYKIGYPREPYSQVAEQ